MSRPVCHTWPKNLATDGGHTLSEGQEAEMEHSVGDGMIVIALLAQTARAASGPWCEPARADYLFVEPTALSAPAPRAGVRRGRRTALTFPVLPPPQ